MFPTFWASDIQYMRRAECIRYTGPGQCKLTVERQADNALLNTDNSIRNRLTSAALHRDPDSE